jgi:2-phosphosulfolactate phosphatase
MMNIDIIISSDYIKENKIKDKVVVVVDMLRATTVIITAVKNRCSKVIPVLSVEEAFELSKHNRQQYVLGGERKALKIPGFDVSNSPLEYTRSRVSGKTVIMTTTNGTKAIKGCESAREIYIGALINAAALAERLVSLGHDIVIVNAGTYGEFSLDDFICSGYIIHYIAQKADVELSDIAYTALSMYKNNEDVFKFLENARHFKVLKELGFEKDLKYCCTKDLTQVVPRYVDGEIMQYQS